MLTDPNVWIADSAAVVHTTTPHKMGMRKLKDATDNDSIAVDNSDNEKAQTIKLLTCQVESSTSAAS
jgi:hypothetical protein